MDQKSEKFLLTIESHKRLIYKIVYAYCKDRQDHNDLIQEIILQLWRSYDNYNDSFKPSTWIYRVSLNTAISFYRQSAKRRNHHTTITAILQETLKSSESYQEDPKVTLLNNYITELNEVNKALIILHLEGLSNKEIANILGISPTNVGTKLSRIKNILRKKFNSK